MGEGEGPAAAEEATFALAALTEAAAPAFAQAAPPAAVEPVPIAAAPAQPAVATVEAQPEVWSLQD
eukprot:3555526-Lingulodinium_polyedra.AAC.1